MKNKLFSTAVLLILFLVSCTSVRLDFGNGYSYRLLTPDYEGQIHIEEYQLISGSFPYIGDDMVFESWTKIDEEGVSLVVFLPTGQTFAKIDWNGKRLTYESVFMPEGKYFAQYIVNDLQICYAPLNALERNLEGSGMSITEEIIGNVKVRTLKKGAKTVETVSYESGFVSVENPETGYSYQIENL